MPSEKLEPIFAAARSTRSATGAVSPEQVSAVYDAIPTELQGLTATHQQPLKPFIAGAFNRDEESIRLVQVAGEGAKGKSGAPVYIIKDEEQQSIGVAKIFTRPEQLAFELSSLDYFYARQNQFEQVKVPQVQGVAKADLEGQQVGIVLYSLAEGRAIDDWIKNVGEQDNPAGRKMGRW